MNEVSALTIAGSRDLHSVPRPPRVVTHTGLALVFIAAHVALAMLMSALSLVATVHAVAVGLGTIGLALTTTRIRNVGIAVGYVAGSEVLWRMNHAAVFWEFGKYVVIVAILIATLRIRIRKNRGLAALYFLLLVPSIALTLSRLSTGEARQDIAFNLSGPLAIAMAVTFFSNIKITIRQARAVFVAILAPVVGIAALSVLSTKGSDSLEFANGSNFVASGGFGPNQVAAMLGLGVMLLMLLSFDSRLALRVRVMCMVAAVPLAVQSALTFARGGLGMAFVGTCAAIFVLIRGNQRARITVSVVVVLVIVLGKYVIEPRLERFTNGRLGERYTSTNSSGRDAYASSELQMFYEHPMLGVGPGIARHLRDELGLRQGASHTEYTRALAEHGLLGAVSLACLVALGVRALRRNEEPLTRAFTAAAVTWTALFLLIYDTRLAAPAVVFGLAFAFIPPTKPPVRVPRPA